MTTPDITLQCNFCKANGVATFIHIYNKEPERNQLHGRCKYDPYWANTLQQE